MRASAPAVVEAQFAWANYQAVDPVPLGFPRYQDSRLRAKTGQCVSGLCFAYGTSVLRALRYTYLSIYTSVHIYLHRTPSLDLGWKAQNNKHFCTVVPGVDGSTALEPSV